MGRLLGLLPRLVAVTGIDGLVVGALQKAVADTAHPEQRQPTQAVALLVMAGTVGYLLVAMASASAGTSGTLMPVRDFGLSL